MFDSQEAFIKLALAEQALTMKTKEFEQVKSFLNDLVAVLFIDHKGKILDVNDTFCKLIKERREKLVGESYHQLISTSHSTDFIVQMWGTLASGEVWNGYLSHRAKDYSVNHLKTTIIPFLDENQNPYQYMIIQEEAEAAEKESIEGTRQERDQLTGLLSREHFEVALQEALKQRRKLALFAFNIEKFTVLNDMFGLDIGDLVLKEVANRLKIMSNTVARVIGDEFLLLCDQYESDAELDEYATYVLKLLKEPFIIEGFHLNVNVGIGISQFPNDGDGVETLINNCRVALRYQRDPFAAPINYYSRTIDEKHVKSIQIANDIHHALLQEQLLVYYQPRVEIQTGRLQGAEALVRWKHPDFGLVDPGDFLPYAEEVGLVVPISEWVLEQACRQNKHWQENGYPPIVISVNISPKHLVRRNFVDKVKTVLEKTNLDPAWLEIELTEDVPIKGSSQVYEAVNGLKELGISVALDDFGSGFLTFNDVKMLNFDTLKIDRTYAKNLADNPVNATILTSLIQLGEGLQKKVVVEGIETERDLQCLKTLGRIDVQGYVFSQPVQTEEFEQFFITNEFEITGTLETKREENENRRQYFRINLPFPLKTKVSIDSNNNTGKKTTLTEVLVDDIGPGGLKFLSATRLPVRSNLLLSFELNLTERREKILGKIVRAHALPNGVTAYGVEFILNEVERDSLISVLHRLSAKIKGGQFGDMNVVKDNIVRFLLSQEKNF